MPELSRKCIQSWHNKLPDFELKLWNELNFDIHRVPFVEEAYSSKKYAFVTDYVRLYVLLQFGGIYLDTDVEILKDFDELLALPGFIGYESKNELQTGVIGSEKNNTWVKEQISLYEGKHFLVKRKKKDLTSNVKLLSDSMIANGFILDNNYRVYKNCMHFFPTEYFCAKTKTGIINITPNTYCIPHFYASWDTPVTKLKRMFFRKIIGPKHTEMLLGIKKRIIKK